MAGGITTPDSYNAGDIGDYVALVDPATSANQTNGNQKTQIVGSTGTTAEVNDDGQLHTVMRGHICTNNSTTDLLLADEVWTGTAEDILDYGGIALFVTSDVASATFGVKVQYSKDGSTNWRTAEEYTLVAGAEKWFTPPAFGGYFRVQFINGSSDQTSFELTTYLHKVNIKSSSHNIDVPITDEDDAELVKAVITGKKANGDYDNVSLTNGANMKVSLEELESDISSNSNSQLNTSLFDIDGTDVNIEADGDAVNPSGKNGIIAKAIMYGRVAADTIRRVAIDASTWAMETIGYEHHEIHGGNHYYVCGYTSLGNGATVDFSVSLPDTAEEQHMTFSVEGTQGIIMGIYEDTTSVTGGTPIIPLNNNRRKRSTNTSNATLALNPTITGLGTDIYPQSIGANKTGGFVERDRELILDRNTVYIFRFTNQSTNTNILNYCAEWYEHQPKD